jgi:hypothetical protein
VTPTLESDPHMRGHPKITVRLHPEALRRLKSMAEAHRGKKSGVAEFIRLVVYSEIDFNSGEWESVQEDLDTA